jgi:regulator of RNase E activity RraA
MRLDYYRYVEEGERPSLAVIQDAEGADSGLGAFWGEVQSNIHMALGCQGVITDGSVRDIEQLADGFFALAGSVMPSHVFADLVGFNTPVSIAGMHVDPGDLIHADAHGCVVVPHAVAGEIAAAAALITRREAVLLKASRRPGFSVADLEKAYSESDDIH